MRKPFFNQRLRLWDNTQFALVRRQLGRGKLLARDEAGSRAREMANMAFSVSRLSQKPLIFA
jgi:hypothetical protein